SMLRTMELILGLKPMSQFDAAARPMFGSFQAKAEPAGYRHVVTEGDLKETNRKGALGTEVSSGVDLAKGEDADDLLLNEELWQSVRGAHLPMPAPVRAAFVFPHPARDRDDD